MRCTEPSCPTDARTSHYEYHTHHQIGPALPILRVSLPACLKCVYLYRRAKRVELALDPMRAATIIANKLDSMPEQERHHYIPPCSQSRANIRAWLHVVSPCVGAVIHVIPAGLQEMPVEMVLWVEPHAAPVPDGPPMPAPLDPSLWLHCRCWLLQCSLRIQTMLVQKVAAISPAFPLRMH